MDNLKKPTHLFLANSGNSGLQALLSSGVDTIPLDELDAILAEEHGRHLALTIEKETQSIEQQQALTKYEDEHNVSLSLLFDIETQKEQLTELNERLTAANRLAYKAGMADVATEILHNTGNFLNNVSTSIFVLKRDLEKLIDHSGWKRADEQLKSNFHRIEEFITKDPNGKKTLLYYMELGGSFKHLYRSIESEIERITEKMSSISGVIFALEGYAKQPENMVETMELGTMVGDALAINDNLLSAAEITVVNQLEEPLLVSVQAKKLVQILINLIANARDALRKTPKDLRTITLSASEEPSAVYLRVTDTGSGINREDLRRIFSYGYTTKSMRKGFGLHNCANYMTEMGGKIWAESEGTGKGATFVLKLPR